MNPFISYLTREALEAQYRALEAQHQALHAEYDVLSDTNCKLSIENDALSAELHNTQLTLNDERNNLALANAELRNLRAWQSLASHEATNQPSTQH
jgi:cell division protein FtsB